MVVLCRNLFDSGMCLLTRPIHDWWTSHTHEWAGCRTISLWGLQSEPGLCQSVVSSKRVPTVQELNGRITAACLQSPSPWLAHTRYPPIKTGGRCLMNIYHTRYSLPASHGLIANLITAAVLRDWSRAVTRLHVSRYRPFRNSGKWSCACVYCVCQRSV